VGVDDLRHDRQAEPGSGKRTGAGGAVEPLEHVRDVRLGDARPLVRDRDHPLAGTHRDRGVDHAARRAPLRRVVQQVARRPFQRLRPADDDGLLGGHPEADPRCVGTHPVECRAHHGGEVDPVQRLGCGLLLGHLDELVDQRRQLDRLAVDVLEQLDLVLEPERGGPRGAARVQEELHVVAQAGQRRAQLVTRVLDQPSLRPASRGQRREHAVEGRGEVGDLPAALHRHGAAEVPGAGHPLHGRGQGIDRP
jgi:hypothetical protein